MIRIINGIEFETLAGEYFVDGVRVTYHHFYETLSDSDSDDFWGDD